MEVFTHHCFWVHQLESVSVMELLQFLGDSPGSMLTPMLHASLHRELGHDNMHHMGCVKI